MCWLRRADRGRHYLCWHSGWNRQVHVRLIPRPGQSHDAEGLADQVKRPSATAVLAEVAERASRCHVHMPSPRRATAAFSDHSKCILSLTCAPLDAVAIRTCLIYDRVLHVAYRGARKRSHSCVRRYRLQPGLTRLLLVPSCWTTECAPAIRTWSRSWTSRLRRAASRSLQKPSTTQVLTKCSLLPKMTSSCEADCIFAGRSHIVHKRWIWHSDSL